MANSPFGMAERMLDHLEWSRVERALLDRCRGASTRRRGLHPADSHESTLLALTQTAEALRLLQLDDPPPLSDLRDVEGHLDHLAG